MTLNQSDALRAWLLRAWFLGQVRAEITHGLTTRKLTLPEALKKWDETLTELAKEPLG